MERIARLKKKAKASCEAKGHTMGYFKCLHTWEWRADCRRCESLIFVSTLGGAAVTHGKAMESRCSSISTSIQNFSVTITPVSK